MASSFINDIRNNMKQSDVLKKLLIINIAVFLVIMIPAQFINSFRSFTGDNNDYLEWINDWFAMSSSFNFFIFRPWTIITYMFMHEGLYHIIFNLMIFYWMGKLLQEYLGGKKLLSTYILGGISGGILYIITYNFFPLFHSSGRYIPMLGASASVMAVTVAAATLLPDYRVHLFLIGEVSLKYIAGFLVIVDLISFGSNDQVAHFAHLGGAIFGFTYIKQLKKGNDLAGWFHKLMDKLSGLFSSSPRSSMKVKYKRAVDDETYVTSKRARQERTDEILDKISKSGYGSLTNEEKEFLFKSSKES